MCRSSGQNKICAMNKTRWRDQAGRGGLRSPRAQDMTCRADARPVTDPFPTWMHEGLRELPHDCAILALDCDEVFLAPHLTEYSSNVTVLDTSGGQLAL